MFVGLDLELGGPDIDKSILTADFILTDEEFKTQDSLSLKLIPDDETYRVDPKALEVNKIDLVELAKNAISYRQAGTLMYKTFSRWSGGGKIKLKTVGKGYHGDLLHIWDKLLSKNSWNNFFSYHLLDVDIIYGALELAGKVPHLEDRSLEEICNQFGIKGEFHNSHEDASCSLMSLQMMLNLLR